MKDFIDKLIEKLYYRRFPDRVDEHAIATAPLPIIREERFIPRTITSEMSVDERAMETMPINYKDHFLKNTLYHNMQPQLEPYIELKRIPPRTNDPYIMTFRGELRILEEDEEIRYTLSEVTRNERERVFIDSLSKVHRVDR